MALHAWLLRPILSRLYHCMRIVHTLTHPARIRQNPRNSRAGQW